MDMPFRQDTPNTMSLIVRPANGSASALTLAVRAAVARVDKERPLTNVRTVAAIGCEANSAARFRAVLIGAFASGADAGRRRRLRRARLFGAPARARVRRSHRLGGDHAPRALDGFQEHDPNH